MVEVQSPTEISVTWDSIPPIDQNGIITEYEVLYTPLETFGGAIGPVMVVVVPPDTSVMLTGLEEYVSYSIRVRVFNDAGSTDYTTAQILRTQEDGKNVIA